MGQLLSLILKRADAGASILVDFASVAIPPKFDNEVLSKGREVLHSIETYATGARLFVKQVLYFLIFAYRFHCLCCFFRCYFFILRIFPISGDGGERWWGTHCSVQGRPPIHRADKKLLWLFHLTRWKPALQNYIYNLPGINDICSRVDPMCFCAASKGVLVTIVENLLVAMAAKDGLEGTKIQIKQLATLLDFALRFDQQKVAARLSTHIQSYTKVHVRNL